MNTEERWLTEITSSQKRTLITSVLSLALAVASISTGVFLYQFEQGSWWPFGENGKPPVKPVDYSGLAFTVIIGGLLLVLGAVYLWQFYTPTGVRYQLRNLQELMSATLETKRHKYKLHLQDGSTFRITYTPFRWAARELCAFQLQSSPMDTWSEVMKYKAQRSGFAMTPASVLSTNCSLEEFFPRTLLLYTTIRRIMQIQNNTVRT